MSSAVPALPPGSLRVLVSVETACAAVWCQMAHRERSTKWRPPCQTRPIHIAHIHSIESWCLPSTWRRNAASFMHPFWEYVGFVILDTLHETEAAVSVCYVRLHLPLARPYCLCKCSYTIRSLLSLRAFTDHGAAFYCVLLLSIVLPVAKPPGPWTSWSAVRPVTGVCARCNCSCLDLGDAAACRRGSHMVAVV